MNKGKFGFPRLTSIGPLVESENELLFHLTRADFVEPLLTDGFEEGYKQAERNADTFPLQDAVKQNKMFEFILDYFKPDNISHIPNRFGANFFLPTTDKINPTSIKEGNNFDEDRTVVIAVDPDNIECTGAVGIYKFASQINSMLARDNIFESYDSFENFKQDVEQEADRTPEFLVDEIIEYWNEVRIYDGFADEGEEVWFNCDIPTSAIDSILDMEEM